MLPSKNSYSLNAVCAKVNKTSFDFAENAYKITNRKCKENNGKIFEIGIDCSGKTLNELWKGNENKSAPEQWESLCREFADFIYKQKTKYDDIVVISHDTPFVNLSYHLGTDILYCWIPHSLGTLFKSPDQQLRIEYESKGISKLKNNHYIGYISNLTKNHLSTYYGFNERLISFYSSIYYNSTRYDCSNQNSIIDDFNIPKNKKLILVWGRCSHQKGIDIILDAYIDLLKYDNKFKKEYHLVLISPTETSYEMYLN
jgi:glycosyltransferase involved in cell wall biosynthesis